MVIRFIKVILSFGYRYGWILLLFILTSAFILFISSGKRRPDSACPLLVRNPENGGRCLATASTISAIICIVSTTLQKVWPALLVLNSTTQTIHHITSASTHHQVHRIKNGDDKDLAPLMKCLSSVAAALQLGLLPHFEHIFNRCISIVENTSTSTNPEWKVKESGILALSAIA